MTEEIRCCKCGEMFPPAKKQKRFLEESKRKGMTFIMLECSLCGRMVSVDPSTCGEHCEPKINTEKATTEPLRCPVAGCSGWVTFVESAKDDKPFWGCGECGAVWYDKSKLFIEIKEIVRKFSYRAASYRREADEFYPVPFIQEDKHYEELVEKESKDNACGYIRG